MIRIDHVSHRYRRRVSLDDVSCELSSGLWGLLGSNGAGKSTLLGILSTMMTARSGSVTIDGVDIHDVDTIRRMVGFLPQQFRLPPLFRVRRVVEYAAWARGVARGDCSSAASGALDRVGLSGRQGDVVKSLSGGMRQRLGIACAIVADPAVLLLDEPTVGLDPASRIGIRNLMGELAEDRTVIVSTHLLEDFQGYVSNLIALSDGRLVFTGTYSELERIGRERPAKGANAAEAGYLSLGAA